MIVFYYILAAIGFLFVVVLLLGFLSPRIVKMNRSIDIQSTPEAVFPYLNNQRLFVEKWSPWTERDPDMKQHYNEIEEGKGSFYSWEGAPKKVGSGSMEILESEPNKLVKKHLKFKGRGEAISCFHVADNGNGSVKVTWDFESDNGMNPVARIFGRFIEKFVGPDYELGLGKLKKELEG